MNQVTIDKDNLPRHIAIIMDGNGRWANVRGLPRIAGHREGVRTVRKITQICGKLGIQTLTLYTFSSENWKRPAVEVGALMKLLVSSLRKEVSDLMKNNVRFTVIGDMNKFDQQIQNELINAFQKTKNNSGLNLNLALSYGSRQEILYATRKLVEKVILGEIEIKDISEDLFSQMLHTKNLSDPDLLIRTGGEFRISNFLLWQIAYTEIHITDLYWPEFDKRDLMNAIYDYQNRERRFGKTSAKAQVENG
jgi:undecaprenyl diphosphate synthase